jgi:hypothetical protein
VYGVYGVYGVSGMWYTLGTLFVQK